MSGVPSSWPGRWGAILALVIASAIYAPAQQTSLALDPARTKVTFTLEAALHTVHGSFQAKPSSLAFDPASGTVSGQVLVDAKSGQTGNSMRDRKMNNDVLESDRFAEIAFRPDRMTGTVAEQGKSSIMLHGLFRVHGVEREITVPTQLEMDGDRWSANAHFTVPYAKWGMKNPSTLFLRVSDSVEIELEAAGTVVGRAPGAHP
jgi:polyisoprenoid-binding protein YceI